ncbi:MAG: hypothetical protein GF401_07090 [Chitinivibrionales bacterium]|nr:hypothetical protein [Chitinivibrionales bacterium]
MCLFRHLRIVVLLIGSTTLFCNIFAPSEDRREDFAERRGAEGVILEGKLAIRTATTTEDWREAARLFDKALEMDSSKSEAYFYKGKCILRIADVDLDEVWDEVNPPEEKKKNVPFLYQDSLGRPLNTMTVDRDGHPARLIDSVYSERKRIYDAVSQAIRYLDKINEAYDCYDYCENSCMGDCDQEECLDSCPKMDRVILRKQYESDYLIEISIKTILSIIDLNSNDTLDYKPNSPYTDEQEAYKILVDDIPSLDSMDLDSLKQISNDPKDINPKLDSLINSLEKANESDSLFRADLKWGAEKTNNQIDTTMGQGVHDMIVNFKKVLPYYYYDDLRDNDGDYYDTDGDGHIARMIWIDWDQDDKIDIVLGNGGSGEMHIGDSAHRAQNPDLYEWVDTTDSAYHRYRYKGDHTYEFIFGDWGVDEEIMDGIDNDFDGLIDEDTRIIDDTLDDDGDFIDTNPADSLHEGSKLIWNDVDNSFTMDITFDTTLLKQHKYLLIAQALQQRNKTLPSYHPDYDTTALSKDSIGSYTGNSSTELQGGDYGIDEEWFDGLDNDGDGLIDEDVAKTSAIPPEPYRDVLISRLEGAKEDLLKYWKKIREVN